MCRNASYFIFLDTIDILCTRYIAHGLVQFHQSAAFRDTGWWNIRRDSVELHKMEKTQCFCPFQFKRDAAPSIALQQKLEEDYDNFLSRLTAPHSQHDGNLGYVWRVFKDAIPWAQVRI